MLRYLKLCMFICVCLPLSAYSSLYTLEYSGHISTTYGNGLGYNLGDYVSGILNFDLSSSTGDKFPENQAYAQYDALGDGSNFVSGYLPANVGISKDNVRTYNGFLDPGAPSDPNVAFVIGDVATIAGPDNQTYALELTVSRPGINWLNGDKITEFSFTDSDLSGPGWSFGSFSSRYDYTAADGTRWTSNDQALFSFDSIQLTAADVPEPGSLLLLLVGCIALLLRRRYS